MTTDEALQALARSVDANTACIEQLRERMDEADYRRRRASLNATIFWWTAAVCALVALCGFITVHAQ